MTTHRPIRALLTVALLLGGTGCAGPRSPINASIREFPQEVRIGDARQNPLAMAPIPPTAPTLTGGIVVPPPPSRSMPAASTPTHTPTLVPIPPDECPAAKPGATPLIPAGRAVEAAPTPASYAYRTGGKHSVGGAQASTIDYPSSGLRTVGTAATEKDASGALVSFAYDVTVELGANRTVTSYEVVLPSDDLLASAPGLFVTRMQTYDAAGFLTSEFVPLPPMTVMPFPADPGVTFSVMSTDVATGTTVSYAGEVGQHEVVDACGEVIDTRRVRHTGSISLSACGSSACPSGQNAQKSVTSFAATYDLALQYGGLAMQDEVLVQGQSLDAPFTDELTGVINRVPVGVEELA